MSLTPGSRLGPYEIVAPLGAGGMGEVWRAKDTILDREVAIKILPTAFSSEPERLARFEREAKVLSRWKRRSRSPARSSRRSSTPTITGSSTAI